MANAHVIQSLSMLVNAPQLQVQLQSKLAADQSPPHEILLGICLDSCVRHVALACMCMLHTRYTRTTASGASCRDVTPASIFCTG